MRYVLSKELDSRVRKIRASYIRVSQGVGVLIIILKSELDLEFTNRNEFLNGEIVLINQGF